MLEEGFRLLTIIVASLLFSGLYNVSAKAIPDTRERSAFRLKSALFLAGWLGYIALLSIRGVFLVASLPPRVPLLLVMPAFTFTVFFFASGKFKNIISHIPASWPVYFQSFRIIVELLLLRAFLEGFIPKEATFEGYNFDILIGLTAPFIGAVAFRKGKVNKPLLVMFNVAGFLTLSVVVFVFISQAYFPSIWHKEMTNAPIAIGIFPYTFLPGFLMPVAVFMHVLSLVKIKGSVAA